MLCLFLRLGAGQGPLREGCFPGQSLFDDIRYRKQKVCEWYCLWILRFFLTIYYIRNTIYEFILRYFLTISFIKLPLSIVSTRLCVTRRIETRRNKQWKGRKGCY